MKRLLFTVAALALCAGMLVYSLPVKAVKAYDNADLDGIYYFVTTEVRDGEVPPALEHCSTYGTIEFDGIDAAVTSENFRCRDDSDSPPFEIGTRSSSFLYSVDSDGSFTLATALGEFTHCQLLNKGDYALCDATASPGTDPPRSFLAIATKL